MDISRRRALALGGGAVLGAAGVAAVAGGAGAAGGWQPLIVVTANIGRKRLKKREPAILAVRRAVKSGDGYAKPLVGWQEIGEGDDDGREARWINKHFGSGFENIYEHKNPAQRVPISVPNEYKIIDKRVTKVHGGKKGVSPHRVITQAVLQHVDDPKMRFVFANTHYVAGAWNGKEDAHEAWRDRMWARHFRTHREEVLRHWRSQGFPVIWTGDVNRNGMPLLMPQHEKRAFKGGIDQIGWVPGGNGTELRLKRTKVVPMDVDGHNARVALMQIRRA
ncbi:hypothetical protein [Streptomyces sp. NPDC005438]|uniref:hypothetical protein n=1 Tax=Streptomyces sp. NPDC005438 TaxID=3156880 RepID=UPI0033A355E7